ncbi:uncharacterized protein [Watersipora subatra]|uniref:uncharacterized protein n=1 Tax=Watersipora subatra TaxID=2589382 RepID=UPI00355BF0CE
MLCPESEYDKEKDWLDELFRPSCPPSIRKVFTDEAIDSRAIFSCLQDDELKEICNSLRIGHRVRVRDAYARVVTQLKKMRAAQKRSYVYPAQPPAQPVTYPENMSEVIVDAQAVRANAPLHTSNSLMQSDQQSSKQHVKLKKNSYIFTAGVKRQVEDGRWSRDSRYPMTKLTVKADYTYTQLLDAIKSCLGVQSNLCLLLDTNNFPLNIEEFTVEMYVRSKRYVGCTRIYIGITDLLFPKTDEPLSF